MIPLSPFSSRLELNLQPVKRERVDESVFIAMNSGGFKSRYRATNLRRDMLAANRNIFGEKVLVLWSWPPAQDLIPDVFNRARPLDEGAFFPGCLLEGDAHGHSCVV